MKSFVSASASECLVSYCLALYYFSFLDHNLLSLYGLSGGSPLLILIPGLFSIPCCEDLASTPFFSLSFISSFRSLYK